MPADPAILHVLYRGPLESCNYGCSYCPFAKRADSVATLRADREALARFVTWAERTTSHRLGILFTPWGEALVRPWYREALVRLSRLPHVGRAVIQTNLSGAIGWCSAADAGALAFRATYHPEWSRRSRFVAKVLTLRDRGIRVSCGVVGFRRFQDEIAALRDELPPDVHVWINAVKTPRPEPYTEADVAWFERIDPLFRWDLTRHPSRGKACRTGASAITIDGDGTVRRCHAVPESIGNAYRDALPSLLRERPCPRAACECPIGYAYLDELDLARHYGDGLLERIPVAGSWFARACEPERARVHLPIVGAPPSSKARSLSTCQS